MIDRRLVFEEVLQAGGTVAAKPSGCSMYPVIASGDRILVSPPADLKKGDIVLYRSGEVKICHRITGTFRKDGKRWFRTRGDSAPVDDPPVAEAQVAGKVTRIERGRCSPVRKVLLLARPVLRFGRLNALLCSLLFCIRAGVGELKARGEAG
jgi:signal peptidase I